MGLLFENETCSRCIGSGQYSYCQMYGTRCFKCGGSGVALTKRGKAAQLWFNKQKLKLAKEVQIGDRIVFEDFFAQNNKVVIVDFVGYREDDSKWQDKDGQWRSHFVVSGLGAKDGERYGQCGFEDSPIRMHVWGEALAKLKADGLAYQASLTKDGKISKRKGK